MASFYSFTCLPRREHINVSLCGSSFFCTLKVPSVYKGQHAWNLKIATLSVFSSACIHPERCSSALKSKQFLGFRSLSLKLWIYVGARRKASCILDVCCLLYNTASSANSELSNHASLYTLKVPSVYKGQHAWNLKIATLSAFSSACIHPVCAPHRPWNRNNF